MDFTFNINKKRAGSNLSRGQLKILILLIFLSNYSLLKNLKDTETILMIDDLSSELDAHNLTSILEEILKINHQVILTGIEGDEMLSCLKKLTNFTQINI
jgi:recombinational DNA repair ATPase RecF